MILFGTEHQKAPTNKTGVNALLSETIARLLLEIFDKRTATLLAWRLRIRQASEHPSDYISSAAAFSDALHRVLGLGADPIERLILRDMYSTSGTSFTPVPGLSFQDYIKALSPQNDDFSDSSDEPFFPAFPLLNSTQLSSTPPQAEEPGEEEDRLSHGSSPVVFDGVEFSDLTVGSEAIPLGVLKAMMEDR